MKNWKKIFCVIGYPLNHTLSPYLFNWIFHKLDLPFVYFKIPFSLEKLPYFISSLKVIPIYGISVTIPYKIKIIPYLDYITDEAKSIESVNTIYIKDKKLIGYNTDWIGFIEPIKNFKKDIKSALILGSGGASRACIIGLKKVKIENIIVCSRNINSLNILKNKFKVKILDWEERYYIKTDMIINTTPLGMKGFDESSPIPKNCLNNFKYVYDIVYNPIKTRFIKWAEDAGCKTILGINMFVSQAIEQLKIWTGNDYNKNEIETILIKRLEEGK